MRKHLHMQIYFQNTLLIHGALLCTQFATVSQIYILLFLSVIRKLEKHVVNFNNCWIKRFEKPLKTNVIHQDLRRNVSEIIKTTKTICLGTLHSSLLFLKISTISTLQNNLHTAQPIIANPPGLSSLSPLIRTSKPETINHLLDIIQSLRCSSSWPLLFEQVNNSRAVWNNAKLKNGRNTVNIFILRFVQFYAKKKKKHQHKI